jgi:hypothetical protein
MPFTNMPIMTCSELVAHVGRVIGASGDTSTVSVEDSLKQVMLSFGDRLASTFYAVFGIQAGICELNLGVYGMNNIVLVEHSCGASCWQQVRWWRTQDNRILFDGWNETGNLRVTYREAPALITTTCLLNEPYIMGKETMSVDTVGTNPTLHVPTSGHIVLGTGDTSPYWFEYRGITIYEPQTSLYGMGLMGVQQMPSQPTVHIDHTFPVGTTVKWGVPVPLVGQLDSLIKQTAAYYWSSKTGTCTSDEDRDVAMQLMNFWSGEAEKAWRNIQVPTRAIIMRQKQPGEHAWHYQ